MREWSSWIGKFNGLEIEKIAQINSPISYRYIADPFFLDSKYASGIVLCEVLGKWNTKGRIKAFAINNSRKNIQLCKNLNSEFSRVLPGHYHWSFPFNWIENNTIYMLPQSSRDGLYVYKFSEKTGKFIAQQKLLRLPLKDSVILNIDGARYLLGFDGKSLLCHRLHENSIDIVCEVNITELKEFLLDQSVTCRPGGKIHTDGKDFLVLQKNSGHYGSGFVICEVSLVQSTPNFSVATKIVFKKIFSQDFKLTSNDNKTTTIMGRHHINGGNIIVFDELSASWETLAPIQRLFRFFRRML